MGQCCQCQPELLSKISLLRQLIFETDVPLLHSCLQQCVSGSTVPRTDNLPARGLSPYPYPFLSSSLIFHHPIKPMIFIYKETCKCFQICDMKNVIYLSVLSAQYS